MGVEMRLSQEQFYSICDVVQKHMKRWKALNREDLMLQIRSRSIVKDCGAWKVALADERSTLVDDLGKDVDKLITSHTLRSIRFSEAMCMNKRFARCFSNDILDQNSLRTEYGALDLGFIHWDSEHTISLFNPAFIPDTELGKLPKLAECKGVLLDRAKRGYRGAAVLECYPKEKVMKTNGFPKETMIYLSDMFKKYSDVYLIELYLPEVDRWVYSTFYWFRVKVPNKGYRVFVYPEVKRSNMGGAVK